MDRLRAARLVQIKKEVQREQELRARGHGEYREIMQDEFLREVTAAPLSLVHFYHRDFERCKIMDMVGVLLFCSLATNAPLNTRR